MRFRLGRGGMTTIIRAPRPDLGWTSVHNNTARDARLSFRARGVLLHLLSNADGFRMTAADLVEAGREGRDAIRAALAELRQAGYLVVIRTQDAKGQWSTQTVVYDLPQTQPPCPDGRFPGPGKPTPGKPTFGESGPIQKDHQKEYISPPTSPSLRSGEVGPPRGAGHATFPANACASAPEGHRSLADIADCGHSDTNRPPAPPRSPRAEPLAGAMDPTATERRHAAPPRRAPRETRGTYLPVNFAVPAEWLMWAQNEDPHMTADVVERAAARFVDHYHAAAGARAKTRDWFATWRNWIRDDLEVMTTKEKSHATRSHIDNSAVARVERATAHLYQLDESLEGAPHGGPLAPDDADLRPPLDVVVWRDR